MRSLNCVVVIIWSLIVCVANGYDIEAIQSSLSIEFNVEKGAFDMFDVASCIDMPTCYGNNPQTPYIQYMFESWNGTYGYMKNDEAIIIIQANPPPCRYHGITPYLFSRQVDGKRSTTFASLADTLNMNTLKVGEDGTFAVVSSANIDVTSNLLSILKDHLPMESTNSLPLPGGVLNLGLYDAADEIAYLGRYALFDNKTVGVEYLRNIPGHVFKVSPKVSSSSVSLFPYPSFRPQGTTIPNEDYLKPSLKSLVSAIRARYGRTSPSLPAFDILSLINYENGFNCINSTINCNGDNRDARYVMARNFLLSNSSNSFVWAVGVQHQLSGKAIYTTVSAYGQDQELGVLSVPDTLMEGSANLFIPNDPLAYQLYAIKFARTCYNNEPFCFVIPTAFPGVAIGAPIMLIERTYVEPSTNVAPEYGSILIPQFIRFRTSDNNQNDLYKMFF